MPEKLSAAPFVPINASLPELASAMQLCQGCDLFRNATQAVPGEGSTRASILLLGEQPGDREDIAGKPFVGPAGQLLDRALKEAGIERGQVYVTNAVKHFSFEERGKRRIHKKPLASQIRACQPWMRAEVAAIRPKLIVCLGVSAAQSLFGPGVRLADLRGKVMDHDWAGRVAVTVHPSALLRLTEAEDREREYRRFVEELTGLKNLI